MENPSKSRKIIRNFGFLSIGKALGDVFTFVLFVFLSRTFGQEGVGQYSFGVALAGFFQVFADFGLYNLSVKELSRRQDGSFEAYYREIISLRFILAAIVLTAVFLVLLLVPFGRETRLIIAFVIVYQIFDILIYGFTAAFIAREEMHLASLVEISLRAMTALVGILIAVMSRDLVMVMAALSAVAFGHMFLAYQMIARKYGRPRLVVAYIHSVQILREALPYAFSELLRQFSSRVDVVCLGLLLGAAAAGVYNVAYRVVFPLLCLPAFAALALFPLVARLYVKSRKELEAIYHTSLNIAILIALPAASGLWLIAPDLITLIFGKDFSESAFVLRFLVWLLLLSCLKSVLGIFLMACDQQGAMSKSQWVAAWGNVLANLLLIPFVGVYGAAVAAVFSEALGVILFTMRLRTVFHWPQISSRLAISSFASMVFYLPFMFFPGFPLAVVIFASVLLYVGTVSLFKEIRNKELSLIILFLKRESGKLPAGQEVL